MNWNEAIQHLAKTHWKTMTHRHFTDSRINEVISLSLPLTDSEREFLLEDTPRFEECVYSNEELSIMNDAQLMKAAYNTWSDYTK